MSSTPDPAPSRSAARFRYRTVYQESVLVAFFSRLRIDVDCFLSPLQVRPFFSKFRNCERNERDSPDILAVFFETMIHKPPLMKYVESRKSAHSPRRKLEHARAQPKTFYSRKSDSFSL